MITEDILNYAGKVSDMANRIKSSYHEIIQLEMLISENQDLYNSIYGRSAILKKMRIKKLHLKRLENRLKKLIQSYN